MELIHAFDLASFDRDDAVIVIIEQSTEEGDAAFFAHNDGGIDLIRQWGRLQCIAAQFGSCRAKRLRQRLIA